MLFRSGKNLFIYLFEITGTAKTHFVENIVSTGYSVSGKAGLSIFGGAPSANIAISDANISISTGDYVQVTGITTGTDNYFRIKDIPLDPTSQVVPIDSTVKVEVHKTTSELILNGQSVIGLGNVGEIDGTPTHVGSTQLTTFTLTKAHGLAKGNKFRVLNAADVNLGDFVVEEIKSVTQFTAVTTTAGLTAPKYILKHGLSANNSNTGKGGELLSGRGLSIYDNESLILVGSGDSNQPVATDRKSVV